jgi:hypothetical protein
MHFAAQGFAHFPTTNICNGVKSKTVEKLIVIEKVLSYTVYYQME